MQRRKEYMKTQNENDITKELNHINTDPLGSYTGRPSDKDEVPVQDADDL